MKREKLEHLETTGIMEGTQCKKMLGALTKWLKVGRMIEALKVTRDRDAWKVMICLHLVHVTRLID